MTRGDSQEKRRAVKQIFRKISVLLVVCGLIVILLVISREVETYLTIYLT